MFIVIEMDNLLDEVKLVWLKNNKLDIERRADFDIIHNNSFYKIKRSKKDDRKSL